MHVRECNCRDCWIWEYLAAEQVVKDSVRRFLVARAHLKMGSGYPDPCDAQ